MSYYILINREQHGPFSGEIIKNKIQAEEITVETLCWKKGMEGWEPIEKVLGATIEEPLPSSNDEKKEEKPETVSKAKTANDQTQPERSKLSEDIPLYELIMGKFRFLFSIFSLFFILLVGVFLMIFGQFFWGFVVTLLIGYLIYQSKGKIFKRIPRLRIFSDHVEFSTPFSSVKVPWTDMITISHYDVDIAGNSGEGLDFNIKKEAFYLSQYSPIGRMLLKISGRLTVFFSRRSSSSPFKIDFSTIGKEDEIEEALEICNRFLIKDNSSAEKDDEENSEEINISWVGWAFYGLAAVDFLSSLIGIQITPYEWSPVVFAALGVAFDRFIYTREDFPQLYKQIAGGFSLFFAILFCLVVSSPESDETSEQGFFASVMEDEFVTEVKSCVFESIDDSITLGNAFDNYKFFKNQSWESFEDEQKRRVVQFIGEFDPENFLFMDDLKMKMEGMTVEQFEQKNGEKYDEKNPEHVKYLKSGGLAAKLNDAQIAKYRALGIPDVSVHYKAQFTLSVSDDSINRGYEGLIFECHDEGFEVTKEYPTDAVFEFIYANAQFLFMNQFYDPFVNYELRPLVK
jgi:hypothetical protein